MSYEFRGKSFADGLKKTFTVQKCSPLNYTQNTSVDTPTFNWLKKSRSGRAGALNRVTTWRCDFSTPY